MSLALPECDAILSAMENASDFYFDPVSQIVMENWSKGRTAPVGDAAACAFAFGRMRGQVLR
ncbi:MAG: hypothetical protein R3C60_13095 [Parvularculaceae bacterium]